MANHRFWTKESINRPRLRHAESAACGASQSQQLGRSNCCLPQSVWASTCTGSRSARACSCWGRTCAYITVSTATVRGLWFMGTVASCTCSYADWVESKQKIHFSQDWGQKATFDVQKLYDVLHMKKNVPMAHAWPWPRHVLNKSDSSSPHASV